MEENSRKSIQIEECVANGENNTKDTEIKAFAETIVNTLIKASANIVDNANKDSYSFYDDADKQKYIKIKIKSYFSPDKIPAKVSVINVGQGTSVLVENENGTVALIDKGPDEDILKNYLSRKRFHRTTDGRSFSKKLNLLAANSNGIYTADNLKNFLFTMITHNHEDHTGGKKSDMNIAGLVAAFCSSGKIVESPDSFESKFNLYAQELKNLSFSIIPKSDTIKHESKTSAGKRITDSKENADSFITGFTHGNTYFIIPGDAESEDIGIHVDQKKEEISQAKNLLIVSSHHGSITGTKNRLIEKIMQLNKEVVFFTSVGKNNKHKHPDSPILCYKAGQLKSNTNGEYIIYSLPANKSRNAAFDSEHGKYKSGNFRDTPINDKQLKARLFYTQNINPDNTGNVQGNIVAKSFDNETVFYTKLTNEDSDSDCYYNEEELRQLNNQKTQAHTKVDIKEVEDPSENENIINEKSDKSKKEQTDVNELSKSLGVKTSQNLNSEVSQIEASVISPEKQ